MEQGAFRQRARFEGHNDVGIPLAFLAALPDSDFTRYLVLFSEHFKDLGDLLVRLEARLLLFNIH